MAAGVDDHFWTLTESPGCSTKGEDEPLAVVYLPSSGPGAENQCTRQAMPKTLTTSGS
jgi:hypothetical protein